MRTRLVAAMAAVVALALGIGGVQAAPPTPYDHSWTVNFSTYVANSSPDVTVLLSLGAGAGMASPPDTSFFDTATATFAGLTPSPPVVGAQTGVVSYDIQTNVLGGLPGNIKASGQPPACGELGTVHLAADPFPMYASVKSLGSPVVDDLVLVGGYPQDQAPDMFAGGIPLGMTHVPAWYPQVMGSLGVPDSVIIGRSMGIAVSSSAHITTNIITVNATQGRFVQVTILGNPLQQYVETSQSITRCPPFNSSVTTFGTSTAHTWNCAGDYWGNALPPGCAGTTTGTAGMISKITGTTGFTYDFMIELSSGPDTDSDIAANGNNLWGDWDNCRLDSNPGQADADSNGIGDACKAGGSWVNSDPVAIGNAGTSCADPGHTAQAAPPWDVCQDADGDAALNIVDNCPLKANDQVDTDADWVGDACDPQPLIPGSGTGYAAPQAYFDVGDLCNQPFTVGTGVGVSSCLNQGAVHYLDASSDGWPDFLNPGTNVCWQDHKADANKDGYSDSDEASPWGGAIAACTNQTQANDNAADFAASPKGVYPAKTTSPSALVLSDPLRSCTGRAPNPDGSLSVPAKKARADVNLDGKVNLLDLGAAASGFGGKYLFPTNLRGEFDQNGDGTVNLLDLGAMAGFFGQAVPGC